MIRLCTTGLEPVSCERRIGKRCELANAERQKITQKRADHMERQKKIRNITPIKNRDRRIFAGQNFICLHRFFGAADSLGFTTRFYQLFQ